MPVIHVRCGKQIPQRPVFAFQGGNMIPDEIPKVQNACRLAAVGDMKVTYVAC